jgi:hypothetical protein
MAQNNPLVAFFSSHHPPPLLKNTCPQEIADDIVNFVVGRQSKDMLRLERQAGRTVSPLAGLAGVSRTFQKSIETFLFSSLQIDSTELKQFERIVVERRRSYVKKLIFVVSISTFRKHSALAKESLFSVAYVRLHEVLVC